MNLLKIQRINLSFYSLYSKIFLKVVRKNDLWESEQSHDKNSFDVTMKKCL